MVALKHRHFGALSCHMRNCSFFERHTIVLQATDMPTRQHR